VKNTAKSWLAILMGVIIAIADIVWVYQSWPVPVWIAEGAIILVADVIWVYLDYSLMRGGKR
jgi:hypothetical protein